MRRADWTQYLRAPSEAVISLRWYQRTRPEAVRHLVAPSFSVLVTLLFAAVWGEPHLVVLALVFVCAFLLVAGQFAEELRAGEIEAKSAAAAKPEVMPLLTRIAEPPLAAPSIETTPIADEPSATTPLDLVQRVTVPRRPRTGPRSPALPHRASLEPVLAAPPSVPAGATDEPPADLDVQAAAPSPTEGPFHQVVDPATGEVMHTCPGFLDACDFAFDFVKEHDPEELEIVHVRGERRENVWSYARREAEASRLLLEDRDQYLETIRRLTRR